MDYNKDQNHKIDKRIEINMKKNQGQQKPIKRHTGKIQGMGRFYKKCANPRVREFRKENSRNLILSFFSCIFYYFLFYEFELL